MITRRTLSKLALGGALAAPMPAFALFHRRLTPEDWAKRLTQEMNAAFKPDCQGRFEVLWLDHQDVAFSVMEANIRLHWPPGMRNRPFLATGDDGDEAFEKLKVAALDHYRSVWTYADGTSCIA